MKKSFLSLFIQIMFTGVMFAQINIIPFPQKLNIKQGELILNKTITIRNTENIIAEASFLSDKLKDIGISESNNSTFSVDLKIDTKQEAEAYQLTITKKGIRITGGAPSGVFYGIQSLLQLLNASPDKKIPLCTIEDKPRYPWRGYMVDESRHFFGKDKIKQLLDYMAYYKLNKFHWHLTDEPGWRIEIKQYPKLTTIGGKGNWHNPDAPALYYTQEEIQEIICYAATLHIEVIPEIDMPGHATAANKAYPENSGGTDNPRYPDFTFNPGKESTYQFLTNILREVGELFPSKYLHIGGDEVSFGNKSWNKLPEVAKLQKKYNLSDLKDVEKYFIHRMIDTVNKLDKILVGWDELLEIDANPAKTVIMWWRHDKPDLLKKSLQNKYSTILCPRRPLYFDFVQHNDHKWGRKWDGFNNLAEVYNFPESGFAKWNLKPEDLVYIKGIQANLWTEKIHNNHRFDYMTYPRICALAEVAWTASDRKNYNNFEKRLDHAYKLFAKDGIQYIDYRNLSSTPEPEGIDIQGKKVE